MNLAHLLERSAAVYGDLPALAFGSRIEATYREFHDRAQCLAHGLQTRLGAGPGERIALFCANHRSYLEAMYAVWIAGAVVVPINAKLHAREARYILDNSGAIACLTDSDCDADLRAAGARCPLLDIDAVALHRGGERLPLQMRSADDMAWLFYTSGTTGRPKGVMLSHGNLLHTTLAYLAEVQSVAPGDALLHAAPLSHGSGLYNFAYVARGGVNVVPESRGFDETEVLRLALHHPGISMFAAPTMVKRLVAAARTDAEGAAQMGTVVYGGGPMYLADIEEAIRVMGQKFAQIYGQGEAPMTITVLPKHVIADTAHPRYLQRLASVGYAQIAIEVSIRDAAGTLLPAGEIGEVCARGPAVMQGYWNNSDATASALRQGWLHTGDVGVFDADGFLTLKDRSSDVIISGGANIYPREVEEVLLAHPRVREVSVIGMPDPEWGESVIAFVVADSVTELELDRLCLANIARFKRPKRYRFVAELPKNNYGKVLKTELRKLATAPV
jgi:acyl-CoA synthetase (AMP-forming)/AMP-acid ligase II